MEGRLFKKDQNWCSRAGVSVFFILTFFSSLSKHAANITHNAPPIVRRHFVQRFGCVILVAANVAASR